jgi:hypothetical protein
MSRRHFDSTENAELRAKIDEAKRRLPLPELMRRLGYHEKHIGKTALCPFHSDQHPSFSVFQGKDGFWHFKCFVCDSQGGDEIAFLVKHFGISRSKAISLYLEMAGFPPSRPPKSHEYPELPKPHGSPECPGSPESLEYPVSPVSEGHGREKALKALLEASAARNACTEQNTATKKRWQLARDLRALEKAKGGELDIAQLRIAFDEWHRLSQPFLDPAKTWEDYFTKFLGELTKVRFATGEGAITNALEHVSKLSDSDCPVIRGYADAPKRFRRLAALHRELSRNAGGNTYFLSSRDAAKASPGMNHQTAWEINRALERLGVIKIVRVGDPRPNGRASEFRYLLPQTENGAPHSTAQKPIPRALVQCRGD